MLHILGYANQQFPIWITEEKSNQYAVTSKGHSGYVWTFQRLQNENTIDLFNVRLDRNDGLKIAIPKIGKASAENPTKRKGVDPEYILSSFQYLTLADLPNEKHPDKRGSILLAVCFEAANRAKASEEGIQLNGTTKRLPLTVQDWIDSYLSVEHAASLPQYLRQEFVTIMAENGLNLPIEFLQTEQSIKSSDHEIVEIISQAKQSKQSKQQQAAAVA